MPIWGWLLVTAALLAGAFGGAVGMVVWLGRGVTELDDTELDAVPVLDGVRAE